jgi:hypothetical protein
VMPWGITPPSGARGAASLLTGSSRPASPGTRPVPACGTTDPLYLPREPREAFEAGLEWAGVAV